MPYKFETKHLSVPAKFDRRRKLTAEQKELIRENKCGYSQRTLAAMFGVSRRTIQFILNPDSREQNLIARKNRGGWKQYYDKEQNTESIRDHRRYKQTLMKKNLLLESRQESQNETIS